jgi:hypothetical protein
MRTEDRDLLLLVASEPFIAYQQSRKALLHLLLRHRRRGHASGLRSAIRRECEKMTAHGLRCGMRFGRTPHHGALDRLEAANLALTTMAYRMTPIGRNAVLAQGREANKRRIERAKGIFLLDDYFTQPDL